MYKWIGCSCELMMMTIGLFYISHLPFFQVSFVVPFSAFVLVHVFLFRRYPLLFAGIDLTVVAGLILFHRHMLFAYIFAALVTAIGVLWAFVHLGLRRVRTISAVVLLIFAVLDLRIWLFYYAPNLWKLPSIVAQQAVVLLYSASEKDPIGRHLQHGQVFFIREACSPDILLIGSQRAARESAFVAYNKRSSSWEPIAGIMATTDNCLLDCSKDRIYVGDFERGRIMAWSAGSLGQPLYEIPIQARRPMRINWFADKRLILVHSDIPDKGMHLVDIEDRKEIMSS